MGEGLTLPLDLVAWSAAIASFLPLLISFLKGQSWSTQAKKNLAMGVAIVTAIVTTAATEGWQFGAIEEFLPRLIVSFGTIQSLAQTTYKGFWEDTTVETKLEAIGPN